VTITRDSKRTWDYVCEEDRALPPEEQTVWTLGVLTSRAQAAILDASITTGPKGAQVERPGSAQLMVVAYGLKGVRNLQDGDGNPVELSWQTGSGGARVSDELLDSVPPQVRIELFTEIARLNRLDATDRKN